MKKFGLLIALLFSANLALADEPKEKGADEKDDDTVTIDFLKPKDGPAL